MRSSTRITKRSVDALTAVLTRTILWDSELRGFGAIALPSGVKSYVVNYRAADGRYRRVTLGQHGNLTPDEARKLAKAHLGAIAGGANPAEEHRAIRNQERTVFATICEEFIAKHVCKNRSARETARVIRTYVLPRLAHMQMTQIRRRDIARLLAGWASGDGMEEQFTRAERYRGLAAQMRTVAKEEPDPPRKNELLDLARQYDQLAAKLTKEIVH